MFWCLVRLSTGALSGGLYTNPPEMAIQSAVACSEAKDGGLLVSWSASWFGWYPPVLQWWSVGVVAADGVHPGLRCILQCCSGGLLVSWQLMECILVWVVSSSLAVEDGFLLITDTKLSDLRKVSPYWVLLLQPSTAAQVRS